jgi:hypothetical protein
MSNARIHRDELSDKIKGTIQKHSAFLSFNLDKIPAGSAIFHQAGPLSNAIVFALLKDYAVARKSKTERTVG